ncbi:MAG: substrate-binding domain-containing protein [Oscillospiraceae bacterium]|nr:substrate-binding domain-containing protein [Oscillospiraceae bacterium]
MKKIIALVLALVMVLALVACGETTTTTTEPAETTETTEPAATETTEPAAEAGGKTIYVLSPSPDHGWTGAVGVFAQEKVDEINAEGRYKAELQAFATPEDQIHQIEDIIANNDGNIGVAMLPANTDVENAIQKLIDAGIPYTAADRIIPGVADGAVSNIKYDNIEIGAAAAAWLTENGLKEGDKVVVIEGDGSSADTDRTAGFDQYLKGEVAYNGKTIETPWTDLSSVTYSGVTGWNPANSQKFFEDYLGNADNADTKYIASWDDGLSTGVFAALEGSAVEASTKEAFLANAPFITGCGGSQALYDIIAGTDYHNYTCAEQFGGIMSVTYPPAMIQTTIQALIDYFDGKDVVKDNTQSAECVTKDNVANYKGFE